jgi:urease accessory protein
MSRAWTLWQLADSAFPTGGFAHSAGLEAARQHGLIRDEQRFRCFLEAYIDQQTRGVLPLTLTVLACPRRFGELDSLADALLSNHVANRASRKQGQALVATAAAAFPDPALADLRTTTRQADRPTHLAPALGAVAAALGVDADTTARLALFIAVRSVVSAAVRLGLVGTLAGQRMTHEIGPRCHELAKQAMRIGLDDLAQTAPVLDILHATHDRLYSRLFQS